MSFTLLVHTAKADTTVSVTTDPIDTSGADLLVVQVSRHQSRPATLTDSKSNTWTPLTAYLNGQYCGSQLYYCVNPTVGSGHTFTVKSDDPIFSPSAPAVAVQAWSGVDSGSAFDQQNGSGATAITTIQPGSITPSQDDELVVVGVCENNDDIFSPSGAYSINSGMTISDQVDFNPGFNLGVGLAYIVQTSAAAINPTWTFAQLSAAATGIASFRAAAGAAGGGPLIFGGQLTRGPLIQGGRLTT